MNCVRVMIASPVLAILALVNMLNLLFSMHRDTFWMSLGLSIGLLVAIFAYDIWGALELYGERRNQKRYTLFTKFSHRVFWILWISVMLLISYCRILEGRGGMYYILTCVIACTVPLFHAREFAVFLLAFIIVGNSGFAFFYYSKEMTMYFFYSTAAMLIIGFICQNFQVKSWTMHQYVYLKAFRDPLTGLLNRSGGNAFLEEKMKWHKGDAEVGVIMLDIDYFKKYNDAYGHDAGDECLKVVAECIREATIARTPFAIRHGGEEFVVLVMNTEKEELWQIAERIRSTVYHRGLPAPYKEVADVVTVSVGVDMSVLKQGEDYETVLKQADEALYHAKKNGRNQVYMPFDESFFKGINGQ